MSAPTPPPDPTDPLVNPSALTGLRPERWSSWVAGALVVPEGADAADALLRARAVALALRRMVHEVLATGAMATFEPAAAALEAAHVIVGHPDHSPLEANDRELIARGPAVLRALVSVDPALHAMVRHLREAPGAVFNDTTPQFVEPHRMGWKVREDSMRALADGVDGHAVVGALRAVADGIEIAALVDTEGMVQPGARPIPRANLLRTTAEFVRTQAHKLETVLYAWQTVAPKPAGQVQIAFDGLDREQWSAQLRLLAVDVAFRAIAAGERVPGTFARAASHLAASISTMVSVAKKLSAGTADRAPLDLAMHAVAPVITWLDFATGSTADPDRWQTLDSVRRMALRSLVELATAAKLVARYGATARDGAVSRPLRPDELRPPGQAPPGPIDGGTGGLGG